MWELRALGPVCDDVTPLSTYHFTCYEICSVKSAEPFLLNFYSSGEEMTRLDCLHF